MDSDHKRGTGDGEQQGEQHGEPPVDNPTGGQRMRAHLVLVTHLPVRSWAWLGLRLNCRYCGQRYPCPPRRSALDLVAADHTNGHVGGQVQGHAAGHVGGHVGGHVAGRMGGRIGGEADGRPEPRPK